MTLKNLAFPVIAAACIASWAGWVSSSDRVFLPRHPAARDLPWSGVARLHEVGLKEPFNRAMTDPINLLYPDVVFDHSEKQGGRLPFWNPNVLCGVPQLANPLSAALYPPSFAWLGLHPLDSMLASAALHVYLAALGAFVFFRAAGFRASAASIGGAAFALSGWMTAHLHNTQLVAVAAWVPWGLAGVEWAIGNRRRLGALAVAASITLQWLAGFPQFAVYGTLAIAIHAAVALAVSLVRDGRRAAVGRAALLASAGLIGLAWAAPQILPSHELFTRSGRAQDAVEGPFQSRLRPGALTGLALPFWFGDPFEASITQTPEGGDPDHSARWQVARLVLGDDTQNGVVIDGINGFGERAMYPGTVILVLAVLGICGRPTRISISAIATVGAGLVLALALPIPRPLLALLGLERATAARAILLLATSIPILATIALDRIAAATVGAASSGRGTLWVFRVVAAVGIAACIAAWTMPEPVMVAIIDWLKRIGADARLGVKATTPEYVAAFRPAFDRLREDLTRGCGFAVAAAFAIDVLLRPARVRAVGWIILTASVCVDLGWFFARSVRPIHRQGAYEVTPAISAIPRTTPHDARSMRFARISEDAALVLAEKDALVPPNVGLVFGLPDAQGYRELIDAGRLADAALTSPLVRSFGISGLTLESVRSPLVDVTGIRFLLAARPMESRAEAFRASGLVRVFPPPTDSRATPEIYVYENRRAFDGVFLVHEATDTSTLPGKPAPAHAIHDGTIDATTTAAFDGKPPPFAPGAASNEKDGIVVVDRRPGTWELAVTLASDGFVLVNETFDPGWTAARDDGVGGELPIARADGSLMAVALGRGSHRLSLRYRPPRFTLGVVLAAIAALAMGACLILNRPRADADAAPRPEPAT